MLPNEGKKAENITRYLARGGWVGNRKQTWRADLHGDNRKTTSQPLNEQAMAC